MAGIYLHIPFCRKACHYCNFHFSTSLKLQNDFLSALLKEIALRKDYLQHQQVSTIYFGGGTPSLLPEAHLQAIMEALHGHYNISPEAEISFEANPDDISAPRLTEWKRQGINRLSIGVQSFADRDLEWMNRAHNAAQARHCIDLARDAGISDLSIDLIYGIPGLSDNEWLDNLTTAASLGIPHLSCYALTVEPGTALHALIRKQRYLAVDSDDQARQFLMMTDFLTARGYLHYEISNFALPGEQSVHNSSYWSGTHYLGLGPSAHSFNGVSRQWNVANNPLYIRALEEGRIPFEVETLSKTQRFNEYLMTSLRTMEGADLGQMEKNFGSGLRNYLEGQAKTFMDKRWLVKTEGRLVLTREGKLFADRIASDLFVVS